MLETVDRHLRDDRLHIVAAPGAGKTTLGLEVFRRLGRPALVLAPTLTVRDQWLRRLEDFLRPRDRETPGFLDSWTSSDLRSPSFFTVATYQAVLSLSRADELASADVEDEHAEAPPSADEVQTLVGILREAGIGTLILDEAHHLKREWWRALERVVGDLGDLTLLSLTGTPPYDATGVEWRRYEELCGPIDDEISVPELVKAGTLCPHQDFVFAVAPEPSEVSAVRAHDEAVASILRQLIDDPRFHQEVESHAWVTDRAPDLDAVLTNPEVAVAMLAFLRMTAAGLPPGLLDGLGLTSSELPGLDRRWWQVLLTEYLYGGSFDPDLDYRNDLAARLREDGVLWRRSLRIERSPPVERALSLSAAKIDACLDAHRAERAVRGESLRQVILTDYIRAEALDEGARSSSPDLGAFPIFDALVAVGGAGPWPVADVALITGSLAVIHRSRLEELQDALDPTASIRESAVPGREGWVRIEGVRSGVLVAAYTRLLGDGTLRALVGTRALLGEGWDAPVVNSLILASFVGASVSTNQMRGRAIRTDPRAPDKVASVWHLAAVAPDTPTGFLDLESLEERFRTFVGLAASGRVIESGIGRLSLPPLEGEGDLAAFNAAGLRRLGSLGTIAEGWREAIDVSAEGQVIPTVSFRRAPTMRPLQLTRTLRYVLYELGFATVAVVGEVVRSLAVDAGGRGAFGLTLLVAAGIPMLLLSPKLLRAAKLAVLHAPVAGSVAQIGTALLDSLRAAGLVEGEGPLLVRSGRTPDGGVEVSLEGGSFYEQSLFADAMGEILGPVGNPRYLITRPVTDLFGTRIDYHAVPHALGSKRELAAGFHEAWMRRVGAGELIYTRQAGGRGVLLAARGRAFSNQFSDPAERLDRWQ